MKINLSPVELDGPDTVELVAGVLHTENVRWPEKRRLIEMMKKRLRDVGLANLASWRYGTPEHVRTDMIDTAAALCIRHFPSELFPGMEFPEPEGHVMRMTAWKQTLDTEQMNRYVMGKLKMFSETGRRQAAA